MKFNLYLVFIALLLCSKSSIAQNYPGGVTGAEVWYIVNEEDLSNNVYTNYAQEPITISPCGVFETTLFNFNPSLDGKICLKYNAPIENSTGRNMFYVGEPDDNDQVMSHFGMVWGGFNGIAETDSIIRNFVDFNNKNLYSIYLQEDYLSDNRARVNFYHYNNYVIDKKFKSYGQLGESVVYIGALTNFDNDATYDDNTFMGSFPESISFPRELSLNEKQRVESYLALKYGLTLASDMSYLNSKSLAFWDSSNNDIFNRRIFGVGRDNISGLNQLQSESTHLKEHLICAVEGIAEDNSIKQQSVSIDDQHFLVFGDNSGSLIYDNETNHGIKYWNKIWLAEITGDNTNTVRMSFQLFLDANTIDELEGENKTIWLIQDKFVGNDEVSSFNTETIIYYEAVELEFEEGGSASFNNVIFDDDDNRYDQFTFGVGAKVIVQAEQVNCSGDEVKIKITGGKAPYELTILEEEGEDPFEITLEEDSEYLYEVSAGSTYTVTVVSSENYSNSVSFATSPSSLNIDLGNSIQYLSVSEPSILLDPGSYAGFEYNWYKDGYLMAHHESTMIVTETGEYSVQVISDDGVCVYQDNVQVAHDFTVTINALASCDEELNVLEIIELTGVAPYVTSITLLDPVSVYNQAHDDEVYIDNLSYGSYEIVVTDALGATVTEYVDFVPPGDAGYPVNLHNQLLAICESCVDNNDGYFHYYLEGLTSFTLDASLLIGSGQVQYEWFANGISLGVYTPQLTLNQTNGCGEFAGVMSIYVVITNPFTGCSTTSDSFTVRSMCPENGFNAKEASDQNDQFGNITTLSTKVFPNPTTQGRAFYYEVSSQKDFDGTVTLVSLSGATLGTWSIHDQSKYTLVMKTLSAGMYLIRVSTAMGTKIDRVIIK